ncbi:MAG: hypothetical protein PHU85_03095 [Phycisphaerae bacterium]|nr:hypothetical protein [Phycisphaerae bacterium]
MEPVQSIDLAAELEAVQSEMIGERRASIRGLVKKILQDREVLVSELDRLDAQRAKAQQKLANTDAKIEKLQNRDWTILPETKPPSPSAEGQSQST